LRELPVALRAQYKRVGIVLDADSSPLERWQRVRKAVLGLTAMPKEPPDDGFIGLATNGCRMGVWLMPDNRSVGALEEFLTGLIPPSDAVWKYACEVSEEAHRRGAYFEKQHTPKASVRTWLAWQEQPGVPPGTAIERKYFNPASPAARGFVDWFQRMFLAETDRDAEG
jgi:hypothetical protein